MTMIDHGHQTDHGWPWSLIIGPGSTTENHGWCVLTAVDHGSSWLQLLPPEWHLLLSASSEDGLYPGKILTMDHVFMVFDGWLFIHQIPSSTLVKWPWLGMVDHGYWLLDHSQTWSTMVIDYWTMVNHRKPWLMSVDCGWPWSTMVVHGAELQIVREYDWSLKSGNGGLNFLDVFFIVSSLLDIYRTWDLPW